MTDSKDIICWTVKPSDLLGQRPWEVGRSVDVPDGFQVVLSGQPGGWYQLLTGEWRVDAIRTPIDGEKR